MSSRVKLPTAADLIKLLSEILEELEDFWVWVCDTTNSRPYFDENTLAIIDCASALDAIRKALKRKGGISGGILQLGPLKIKIERDSRYEGWWKC